MLEASSATVTERLILAAALLSFLLTTPSDTVLYTYITLGQAHFVMTYFNQRRRGAYTKKGLSLYIIFLFAATMCMLANKEYFVFFVSMAFLLHSFFDDIHLMRTSINREVLLSTIPCFSLIIAISCDKFLQTQWASHTAAIAMAGYLAMLVYVGFKRLWHNPYILYMLCITPAIFLLYFSTEQEAATKIFGFIILMHCFNWYSYMYHKFKSLSPEKLRPYFLEMIGINLVMIAGLLLSLPYVGQGLVHDVLFFAIYYPPSFYVWSLMHLIITLRKSDYSRKNLALFAHPQDQLL